jgi:hypothetical protein
MIYGTSIVVEELLTVLTETRLRLFTFTRFVYRKRLGVVLLKYLHLEPTSLTMRNLGPISTF